MSFQDAAEAPIVVGSLTFPKLTIRATAGLAAKKKSEDLARLRALSAEEKMLPDNKARFLALTATADYGRGEVWDWAVSLEGAAAVCVASLVQGGTAEADAVKLVDLMPPDEVCDAALEIVSHPNSPRRIAEREEAAKAANPPPAA